MKVSQKLALSRRFIAKIEKLARLHAESAAAQLELVTEGRLAFELLAAEERKRQAKWAAEDRAMARRAQAAARRRDGGRS